MSVAGALFLGAQGRLRSGWRAAIFVVVAVITIGLGGAAAELLLTGLAPLPGAYTLAVRWIGLTVGLLAAHVAVLALFERFDWGYVGLARAQAAPAIIGRGLLLGALPIALVSLALIALGWLSIVRVPGSALGNVGGLAIMFLAAALFEELLMRGYLLSVLREGIGTVAAVLLTSIVFGLLHLQNPGVEALSVTVVVVAGIFLAAVRLATGSLYAAWAAHAAWNMVMALLLHTAVSGTSIAAPGGWSVTDTGPDWATGGPWGPEGGAPAAGVLLVATWYLFRRRGSAPANVTIAQERGEPNG